MATPEAGTRSGGVLGLGVAQVAVSGVILVFGIAATAVEAGVFVDSPFGTGVWVGIFGIVAGAVAIAAGLRPSGTGLRVANLVLSVTAALFGVALVILTGLMISIAQEHQLVEMLGLNAVLLVAGIVMGELVARGGARPSVGIPTPVDQLSAVLFATGSVLAFRSGGICGAAPSMISVGALPGSDATPS